MRGRCDPVRAGMAYVALGYWLGKKQIFVLSTSYTPSLSLHPPAVFLQTLLLFTKQIKFSSRFSTFLVLGLSSTESEVMKTLDANACLLTAETTEMNSGLLWCGLSYSSRGWNDSPLIAAQRFGDGTPSVLEFHLISYTTSFAVVSQDSWKGYWLRAYLTFYQS